MASSDQNSINIRVGVTGDAEAKAALESVAATAEQSQLKVATAADTASAALQKQLGTWTDRVDPAARAQKQLATGQQVFNDALAAGLITGDQHVSLLAKLEGRYGAGATAVAAYGAAHEAAGGRVEGFREILRGTTDIATGNITGMARAGAMLGNTFGLITNPVVIGVAAIAAGLYLASQRAEQLDSETRTLDVALKGIGDTSGASAQQLMRLADSLQAAGASRAQAQALVLQGARSGNLTPSGIGALSQIALGIGAATGADPTAAMQKLLDMVARGYPAIQQLDQQFNFLTKDELAQIQTMSAHGDRAGALGVAIDALGKRFDDLHGQSLTPLQNSMHDLGTAWDDLLDKLAKSPSPSGFLAVVTGLLHGASNLFSEDTSSPAYTGDIVMGPDGKAYAVPKGTASGAAGSSAVPDRTAEFYGTMATPSASVLAAGRTPAQNAHDIALQALDQEAQGQLRVAAAYEQSTVAGLRATAMEQGRLETLRDNTLSEGEYAAAILARGDAAAKAAAAQALTVAQRQNAAGARLVGASAQGPAALGRAQGQNQAIATLQPSYDAAYAAGDRQQIANLDQELQLLTQLNEQRRQQNLLVQANHEDQQLQQTLAEKQLELSLMRQTPELRAQEISDLQTRNQLISEGYEIGTQAFDDELAKREAINAEIAKTDVAIQRIQKDQKSAQQAAQEFGNFGVSAFRELTNTTETWDQKLKNIGQTFADLIVKLTIMKPLEDELTALSGKITGTGGGGLSGLLSSFFGSGSSITGTGAGAGVAGFGDLGLGNAGYAKGGAFDRGRPITAFANGGVVNQPTLFGMASGLGVMGDDGPEAAMPLRQMSNGKLGVHAEGLGGTVNHFYINAPGADPAAAARIDALARDLNATKKAMPALAVTAIAGGRASRPGLLQPHYGS